MRRSATVKYLVAVYIGAIIYCEWFVYYIEPVFWPTIECHTEDPSCTKIMFIADPQIQGDYAAPAPFHQLFSWDSDRYLKSTFTVAAKYFKPDVLVYLGDVMDEGSKSTMQQFHGYAKRLSNIFDLNYTVMQIWIPGDNDIGGEGEPVRKDKIAEFNRVFDQPSVLSFHNVTFYKVNAITHTIPDESERPQPDNNFKIIVSHYPVTVQSFGHQVNHEIGPDIFFCAHDHSSVYVKQSRDLKNRIKTPYEYGEKVLNIPYSADTLYEIYVPTCSYRMGTSKIGYGVAVLDNKTKNLQYTVLWSPTRFPYLVIYLAFVMFLILYFIIFCALRLFYACSNNVTKLARNSSDRVALLDKV